MAYFRKLLIPNLVPFLFFIFSFVLNAQTLSIGQFSVGHSPIQIEFEDFIIQNKNSKIRASFKKETLQWMRSDKNLLTPRVVLVIEIDSSLNPVYIKSDQQLVIPLKKSNMYTSKIYIDLFSPQKIQIFQNNQLIDEIVILAKPISQSAMKRWIDYSCLPYMVNLKGIQTEYVSVGCNLDLMGPFGEEKPRLEVTLSSTNLISPLKTTPPFTFYFDESSTIETQLINSQNLSPNTIELSATLPLRMPRLRLAGGLGPYSYTNKNALSAHGPNTTLSYMVYGKLSLTETHSLKAFDALIYDGVIFNNSGLYYSFDLGRLFDGRVIFGTLLGFQGLHYRYDETAQTKFEMIYPQGFELTYLHPFGQINSYLNYGMFISTTQDVYRNIWIRYGKRIFYELNYIAWGKEQDRIDMWGLSIGFPLAQFF